MIAYEEENDIKMEVYKGEYDDDIEAKLEQVNVELDYNNQEERDEIISNDENEGLTSQKYNALSPCVIIDNIYDQDAIQQVNNNHLKLGVIHCNALENFFISKSAFNEMNKPRFICCAYYECLGRHIYKRIDETPSFFTIQILFFDTPISNSKECDDIDCEKFGREFGIKLWKSRKAINEKKDSLNSPESLLEYFYAFPDFITAFFQELLIEIFN
ncbi:unnamed protein product [Rhizophagus irregularis]|nr:unnamed protein product [Rhizophagus irregularis]